MDYHDVADKIEKGGVGILPTDTMYGIVGSALKPEVVLQIYEFRKRDLDKPFIILIGAVDDILMFNPDLSLETKDLLQKIWPAPVSVVLPVPSEKWKYLTRGTGTLAFRLPEKKELRELLLETGPLVAPSANVQGKPPAETMDEARKYFLNLDFYVDEGTLSNSPSTLISLENNTARVLREGAWKLPDFLL